MRPKKIDDADWRRMVIPAVLAWLLLVSGSQWTLAAGMAPGSSKKETALPPDPLTLEDAVRYGLAHNPLLNASKEEVRRAEEGVKEARGDFLPRLDSGYGYTHWNDDPIVKINGIPGFGATSFQAEPQNLNRWHVNLTMPVFTGFALESRYQIAGLDRDINQYHEVKTRLDLVQVVRQTFIQILLTQKAEEVVAETILQLKGHRSDAQAFYRQGLVPQNDVLRADVALADALQSERVVKKNLKILHARLNQLLGLDSETVLNLVEWKLRPSSEIERILPSLDDLIKKAQQQRPELHSVDAELDQSKAAIRLAESDYYPEVSLMGTYYRQGDDFFATNNDFANNENAAVGVRVKWNLFEGGKTKARVNQGLHRRQALTKQREDLLNRIRVQVEDAYQQLHVARSNLGTAEVAVKQAQENRRMTTVQYREQIVIFTEVLDAEAYLVKARTNYYRALYGYQLAWVDLERAIGGPLSAEIGDRKAANGGRKSENTGRKSGSGKQKSDIGEMKSEIDNLKWEIRDLKLEVGKLKSEGGRGEVSDR